MNKSLLLILGLAATGCADTHSLDFTMMTDPPASVLLDGDRIEIPAGIAVGAEVIAVENDARRDYFVELETSRSGVLGLDPTLEEDDREWVIWGISPGTTRVDVFFNGAFVYDFQAQVGEPRSLAGGNPGHDTNGS